MRTPRVLFVEDDPDQLSVWESQLKKRGCEVVTATDGSAGYDKLVADESISHFRTDWGLPEMDGLDLLKTLLVIAKERLSKLEYVVFKSTDFSNVAKITAEIQQVVAEIRELSVDIRLASSGRGVQGVSDAESQIWQEIL